MSFGRAFSALTGASAVTMAAQLVRGKLAAVLLGPAGVGIFNQLSLLFNLSQLGGQLGSFQGLVRHSADALAAEDRDALRRLAATATLLLGAVSCLIAAAGVLLAPMLSDLLLHDGGAHAHLVALVMLAVPFGVTAQTYRALLSGARAVRSLVATQIVSDLGSLLIFAALILPLGLTGALLGFMASHLTLFVAGGAAVRRQLGRGLIAPRISLFRKEIVRQNVGFGLIGLFMTGMSNLSVLLVSMMVIGALGVEANGIFANGWRIASVYLGAVTATTISYFLPTLMQAPNARAMSAETNRALRFYLLILPPLMAGIMIGGEILVCVILSSEFLPVAGLLLLFVPAELMRILAETMSTSLLARKKLALHALLYACQAGGFVVGAWLLLPRFGLIGAAGAYGLSTALYLLVITIGTRIACGNRLDRLLLFGLLRATTLLAASAAVSLTLPFGLERIGTGIVLVAAWVALGMLDPDVRSAVLSLWRSKTVATGSAADDVVSSPHRP